MRSRRRAGPGAAERRGERGVLEHLGDRRDRAQRVFGRLRGRCRALRVRSGAAAGFHVGRHDIMRPPRGRSRPAFESRAPVARYPPVGCRFSIRPRLRWKGKGDERESSASRSLARSVLLLGGCKGPGQHLVVPTPPSSRYSRRRARRAPCALDEHISASSGDLTTTCGAPEGLILWTKDAGKRWHRAGVRDPRSLEVTFTDVYFSDRVRGWVAGRRVTPRASTAPSMFRTRTAAIIGPRSRCPRRTRLRSGRALDDVRVGRARASSSSRTATRRHRRHDRDPSYQTTDGGRIWAVVDLRADRRRPRPTTAP